MLATAVCTGLTGGVTTAHADAPVAPFQVSVTPTQGVVDGQYLSLNVQRTQSGTDAGLEINNVQWTWCQQNVQLPTFTAGTEGQGFDQNSQCISSPRALSSTPVPVPYASPPVTDTSDPDQGDYGQLTSKIVAQVGTANLFPSGPGTLTCDPTNPCTLAIDVTDSHQGTATSKADDYYFAVPVTYGSSDAVTACGGSAAGAVSTVGSDRLTTAYENWTLGACKTAGAVGGGKAPTTDTFESEGNAIDDFADGSADLAYSAVGYSAAGFTPPTTSRAYVAVPIALNAVVVATSNGYAVKTVSGQNAIAPYDPIEMTPEEAGGLIAYGGSEWDSQYDAAVMARNPQIQESHLADSPVNAAPIVMVSGTDATTLFDTTFFNAAATTTWHTGGASPTSLGVFSNWGLQTFSPNTYSGQETLVKDVIFAQDGSTPGPIWALTDSATASSIGAGLTDVALQSADGTQWVTPTVASMDAAVSEMTAQPDGTLMPDPTPTKTADGVEPYPMTFVEYALAPAQPLENSDCTPNTTSQQLLTQWLSYITGSAGQAELPAGMAPLPPSLQAQAQTAIAKVGQSPTTATCPPVSGTTPPAATGTGTGGTGGVGGVGSVGAFGDSASIPLSGAALTSFAASTALGGGPATVNLTPTATKPVSSAVELTRFNENGTNWLAPAIGLALLAVLLPALALMASGTPLSEVVGSRKRRLASATKLLEP